MPDPIDWSPARAGTASAAAVVAGTATAARPRTDTAQSILATALLAEHLSAAIYYAGLTIPTIIRSRRLAGTSGRPLTPGLPPGGNPQQVHYLQAALDAELQHMTILARHGARLHVRGFYVPARALQRVGRSVEPDSFLGLVDRVETLTIGLYLAAVNWLTQHGELQLALLAGQLAGVEAEHRMLGRAISELIPANNLTLESEPFGLVSDARAAMQPFLTGQGFHGALRPLRVPTAHQAAHVIGHYGTRRVHTFL